MASTLSMAEAWLRVNVLLQYVRFIGWLSTVNTAKNTEVMSR